MSATGGADSAAWDAMRPQRIVSLLPSATEILFALGAGDRVVAVTHECDYPPAAARLPAVTGNALPTERATPGEVDRHIRRALHQGSSIYWLDERRLAALQPDLILTQELCEVCAVAYREVAVAVRRLPGEVPVLSLEPGTLEEVLETIATVATATRTEAAAREVLTSLRSRLEAVRALPAPQPPPRVLCLEWTEPLMVGGHWVPDMVAAAGGVDVLGRPGEPSRAVTVDEVVAAAPDLAVMMPCGYHLERTRQVSRELIESEWFRELPCARGGEVIAVDGSAFFNRPGPRVVDGTELLAAAFRARPGEQLPPGASWLR